MSTLDDTRHPRRIDHRGNDRGDAVRPGPHLGGVEVTSPALTRPGPCAWRQNFREIDVRVLACNGLAGAGGSMIKSDLVRRVAGKNPHLHAKDAERIVNAVLDVIGAALARRDRVETRGFGVFTVRLQSARPGRNPKNGAAVSVPAKFYPYFRPSKAMHSRLNRETGS
jgi:integration host factor subunit beta